MSEPEARGPQEHEHPAAAGRATPVAVCRPPGRLRDRAERSRLGSAAEIKQLFLQYQEAGVDFFQPLKQEPWGARTFIVRDPDISSS